MHFGFTHLAICVLCQMIAGSFVESVIGPQKMFALYVLTPLGANLFAAMASPLYGLGSEPIIMA